MGFPPVVYMGAALDVQGDEEKKVHQERLLALLMNFSFIQVHGVTVVVESGRPLTAPTIASTIWVTFYQNKLPVSTPTGTGAVWMTRFLRLWGVVLVGFKQVLIPEGGTAVAE